MPFKLNNDINKTNLILDLIGARQEAVSANIANVNTPGYVKQDISFNQYLGTLSKPLETKLSKKMGPGPIINEKEGKVIVAEELMTMQRNALFYSIASRRISLLVQQMKTVTQLGR